MTDREYTEAAERLLTVEPAEPTLSLLDKQVIRRKAVKQYGDELDISDAAIGYLRALVDELRAGCFDRVHVSILSSEADDLLRSVNR